MKGRGLSGFAGCLMMVVLVGCGQTSDDLPADQDSTFTAERARELLSLEAAELCAGTSGENRSQIGALIARSTASPNGDEWLLTVTSRDLSATVDADGIISGTLADELRNGCRFVIER